MLQVILPLKDLALAKSRLMSVLDEAARVNLVRAMAADLIDLLCGHRGISSVTVVVGEHWSRCLPRLPQLRVLNEKNLDARDLNALLGSAFDTLSPQRGLVLHGDLPLLAHCDIDAMQRQLNRLEMILCPDRLQSGTNGLACRDSARPTFRFGTSSFAAHQDMARHSGCAWTILDRPGFALDVDTPTDLDDFLRAVRAGVRVGARTERWVSRYGSTINIGEAKRDGDSIPPTPVALAGAYR